ncbi:hypothetical protein J6590_058461 [Homalodisca vitripennis]|nr:hypothetical protein J6590_058461 [Homalodisca vitripennis]
MSCRILDSTIQLIQICGFRANGNKHIIKPTFPSLPSHGVTVPETSPSPTGLLLSLNSGEEKLVMPFLHLSLILFLSSPPHFLFLPYFCYVNLLHHLVYASPSYVCHY